MTTAGGGATGGKVIGGGAAGSEVASGGASRRGVGECSVV